MLEAMDPGASVLPKKGLQENFSGDLQMKQKKGLQNFFSGDLQKKRNLRKEICQAISKGRKQNRSSQIFRDVSGVFQQNFNGSEISAVLEPRTAQFSRT